MSKNHDIEPETIAQLAESHPILKDLPGLRPAEEFDALQSADFGVLATVVDEQLGVIRDESSKAMDRAYAIRAIVAYMDDFFSRVALDADAYKEWSKGRMPGDLIEAYMALYGFYASRLGKSRPSSDASTGAGSN